MIKPSMKMKWKGIKGNKYRTWTVTFNGKSYFHTNKESAYTQYSEEKRVYQKRK